MGSKEVMGIAREFVLAERLYGPAHLRRLYEPQKPPADRFEQAVNPFHGDAGAKCAAQKGFRIHRRSRSMVALLQDFCDSLHRRKSGFTTLGARSAVI